MRCENYQDVMMAYLDGELDAEDAAQLQAHCQSCAACRAELEALSALIEELQATGQAIESSFPPLDLVASVMAAATAQRAEDTAPAIPETDLTGLMTYLEDAMDDVSRRRFERRLSETPSLRAEADALRALGLELECLGDSLSDALPEVDLVDSVMRAAGITEAPPAVVPFRTRPKPQLVKAQPRPRWQGKWIALAAAVVLVAALGLLTQPWFLQTGPNRGQMANEPGPGPIVKPETDTPSPQDMGKIAEFAPKPGEKSPALREPSAPLDNGEEKGSGQTDDSAQASAGNALTLDAVLAARRKALLEGADRLSLMGQWASLTPEEARALISQSGLSKEALIGAAQFLPPDEAAAILKAAVDGNPEDPYLRYALAKNYARDNVSSAEAQAQLAAWSGMDPDNSLPLYMDARAAFAQNDPESAVTTLETASAYGAASAYGLHSAQYQEHALVANGMNADVARFLVASTAGSGQYSDMTELAQDLVRYGQYYESLGDYETAKQVYNAVRQMGGQLVQGAALSTEQLAGLDTQIIALDAFQQLYNILQDPVNQMILEAAYNTVRDGLAVVGDLFNNLDVLWAGADANSANTISNEVIHNGDLNLLTLFGY